MGALNRSGEPPTPDPCMLGDHHLMYAVVCYICLLLLLLVACWMLVSGRWVEGR